jgi:hypothetical protein
MKQIIKTVVLSFIFLFCSDLFAQQKDMQTWITGELIFPLFPKVEIGIENEMRFINNTSLFGRNQTEITVKYLADNSWNFGIGYRLKSGYPFSEYSFTEHRWFADIIWKTRFNRFRLNTRFRLQNDQDAFLFEPFEGVVHREKVRLAYKKRKSPFMFYTGAETYFRIAYTNPFEFRELKLFVGCRMSINKQTRISVDLIKDREFNRRNPLTVYILQFGFSYSFNKASDE